MLAEQLSIPEHLKAQSATALLEAALVWIEANPQAWHYIVGAAQRDALDGVPVRVKAYLEHLRYKPMPWATETIKLPNAFSAAFTRILAAWYPDLEPYIPRNKSKLDGCVLPPRPSR